MDPFVAVVGGAVVGGAAAYIGVYNQNAIAGALALALGAALLLIVAGATSSGGGGLFSDLDTLLAEGGILALVGLVVGGVIGGYFADQQRSST